MPITQTANQNNSSNSHFRRKAECEFFFGTKCPKALYKSVRIVDYSKFLYQQKKKAKEIKSKIVKVVVKEIRFGPNTDDHDYDFKLKHAENFLKEGAKVKAYVFFRGRQIVFKDQGEILLLRFATDLEELAKVEQMPRLEGKRMILILAPKPKK